jgi:hypothetical protein
MPKFSEKLPCPVYGEKFIETYAIMASTRQDGCKKRRLSSAKPRKERVVKLVFKFEGLGCCIISAISRNP